MFDLDLLRPGIGLGAVAAVAWSWLRFFRLWRGRFVRLLLGGRGRGRSYRLVSQTLQYLPGLFRAGPEYDLPQPLQGRVLVLQQLRHVSQGLQNGVQLLVIVLGQRRRERALQDMFQLLLIQLQW